jgi:putative transposase
MARATTASFICELPLRATPTAERELLIRLDGARMIYNACLGESLRRLAQLRESRAYKDARQMSKGMRGSDASRKRAEAFRLAKERVGFREYDLHAYAKQFGGSWLGKRLDSLTIQKTATRAFLAVQQFAFGKRGKPRFKGKGWYDSVEGKTNTSGILWRENKVRWFGLDLLAVIDPQDEVIAHGLACPVKFVRIVRRKLNGRNRFYAQLICEGLPYRKEKHTLGQGVLGLDIGPSAIAIVSEQSATLERFCEELEPKQKEIRKLQRKLDRQRRAGNPDHYSPNGTIKPGQTEWYFSHRYVHTREQLAELHRKQAAQRKSLHGRQVNRILAQGNVIKLERLSYRAFQKRYGKSVGFRGPGNFVAHLRRKAAKAGAEVDEFPTQTTRLSQVCLCGAIEKKPLSLRWHVCECGVGPVQRDLFSAWLARFVVNQKLDAGQAQAAWLGEDERLRVASSLIQPAMGQGQPAPNPAKGQSRSPAQSGVEVSEACQGALPAVTRKLASQPEPPRFSGGEKSVIPWKTAN